MLDMVCVASSAPCNSETCDSISQDMLLLQVTETQLAFGLSSIGNAMAQINGSPSHRQLQAWLDLGLSGIRPWARSFLIWLCFLLCWLYSQEAFLHVIPPRSSRLTPSHSCAVRVYHSHSFQMHSYSAWATCSLLGHKGGVIGQPLLD